MTSLRKRLLIEFDKSTVDNHILPVVKEWQEEKCLRKFRRQKK
jgi:hypothetical protein